MDLFEYNKFVVAMLSIIDPVAIFPFLFTLTKSNDKQTISKLIKTISLTVTFALLISLLFGPLILTFFGISIPAFRIAGGILLFILALEMMRGSSVTRQVDGTISQNNIFQQAIVPIAIPLLAGPGAISTVIVYSYRHDEALHIVFMAIALAVVGCLTYMLLKIGQRFSQHISDTAISIIGRIMGLIIAAIAVEFIANGIKDLFGLV